MVVSYKRLNFDFFVSTGAIMIFMPSFFDILSFRDILFERESELVSSGGSFILRFLYSNMQVILYKKLISLVIGKFSFCDVQNAVKIIHK